MFLFFFFFNCHSKRGSIFLMMGLHSFSFNLLPVFTGKSKSLLTEPHLNIISKASSVITLFVPHSKLVNHSSWALCVSQGRVKTVISQTLLGISSSKQSFRGILMCFSTGLFYFRSVWQHGFFVILINFLTNFLFQWEIKSFVILLRITSINFHEQNLILCVIFSFHY